MKRQLAVALGHDPLNRGSQDSMQARYGGHWRRDCPVLEDTELLALLNAPAPTPADDLQRALDVLLSALLRA